MMIDREADGKKAKILVIDDHAATRTMVLTILKKGGFSAVIQADSVPQAILKMKDETFDLIICDWNMPGDTGLDFLEMLRAQSKYRDLPFLMLTAEAQVASVKAAVEAGVTDYIAKPFTSELVLAKVERALAKNKGCSF